MPVTAMAQTDEGDFDNTDSGTGRAVLMDPLSGPTGSPKSGATTIGGNTTYPGATVGLSTGIGFGPGNADNAPTVTQGEASLSADQIQGTTQATSSRNFADDLVLGVRAAWQQAGQPYEVEADACMVYIGGGKSDEEGVSDPYTAGTNIAAFGQGALRDGGAGPAYTGFPGKVVTAAAGVADGAAVETGFNNRTGGALLTGQSTFGIGGTANDAAA